MREASKHTPGPWTAKSERYAIWIVDARGREVANASWHDYSGKHYPLGKAEGLANAALIAAAPDGHAIIEWIDDKLPFLPDGEVDEDFCWSIELRGPQINAIRAYLSNVTPHSVQEQTSSREGQ